MKWIIYAAASLLLASCKGSAPTSESNPEIQTYISHCQSAEKSPVTETTLFAGFRLGMTEEEVDSTAKALFDAGKMSFFFDRRDGFSTIHDREEVSLANGWEYEMPTTTGIYYINFIPRYYKGQLSQLFCTVKSQDSDLTSREITKTMITLFEGSDRAPAFKKYILRDSLDVSFIKDNLEISFYPQPELPEATIHYINLPTQKEENRMRDSIDNPSRLF